MSPLQQPKPLTGTENKTTGTQPPPARNQQPVTSNLPHSLPPLFLTFDILSNWLVIKV